MFWDLGSEKTIQMETSSYVMYFILIVLFSQNPYFLPRLSLECFFIMIIFLESIKAKYKNMTIE